jgi:hypothetical protein
MMGGRVAELSEEVGQGIETSFAGHVSHYGTRVWRLRQRRWQITATAKSALSCGIALSRHCPLVDKSDQEESAGRASGLRRALAVDVAD